MQKSKQYPRNIRVKSLKIKKKKNEKQKNRKIKAIKSPLPFEIKEGCVKLESLEFSIIQNCEVNPIIGDLCPTCLTLGNSQHCDMSVTSVTFFCIDLYLLMDQLAPDNLIYIVVQYGYMHHKSWLMNTYFGSFKSLVSQYLTQTGQ